MREMAFSLFLLMYFLAPFNYINAQLTVTNINEFQNPSINSEIGFFNRGDQIVVKATYNVENVEIVRLKLLTFLKDTWTNPIAAHEIVIEDTQPFSGVINTSITVPEDYMFSITDGDNANTQLLQVSVKRTSSGITTNQNFYLNIKPKEFSNEGEEKDPSVIAPFGMTGKWSFLPSCSDEFNGSIIDDTKWNNNPGSWGPWSWRTDNTYIKDEVLEIRMRQETHIRNGKELYYTSGILRSNVKMTYGYYEAKVKGCERFPGAAPAFWIYSTDKFTGEIRYSEVDFFEIEQAEWENGGREPVQKIDMNLHTRVMVNGVETWKRPNGFPDLCKSGWTAPWDPRDDYHIYGCEVTPEKITWYVDGIKRAEKPNVYWHLPMHVTLSLGLRYPFVTYINGERYPDPEKTTTEGFPTSMKVDWVRVWERIEDTSVKENIIENGKIAVYPNPVENVLYIENRGLNMDLLDICLSSMDGKVVKSESIEINKQNELNLSNLNKGIYLLSIKTNDNSGFIKLYKK